MGQDGRCKVCRLGWLEWEVENNLAVGSYQVQEVMKSVNSINLYPYLTPLK